MRRTFDAPGLAAALLGALACGAAMAASGAAALSVSRAGEPPAFAATISPLDHELRERMKGSSWHHGCPVGLGKLRLLEISYWGFDDRSHHGRLVVQRRVADDVVAAMRSLFEDRYPIRRMVLIDRYGGDDHRSMAADNTSAFNCRFIAGQPGVWSQHAYGRAIDINPVENPYVSAGGSVSPPAGEAFADRSKHEPGMIHDGDSTVRAFADQGWGWGGNWSPEKDYQHFSASGG
ncbi:MAG TPA: M15 family metallopeptidase [Solirubrobacterales bacterium]|nr:M15 family metallopeptidase [Solirubrobacterales bacterium]